MIPSIEQICEDLAVGRISIQQATEWLHLHMHREDQRDIFAAAALQGLIIKYDDHSPTLTSSAYKHADAMLAERAKA